MKYLYDEDTGERALKAGEPILRHAACPPLCQTRRGCPKGTPEQSNELSLRNRKTYQLFKEAQACGGLPPGWESDTYLRYNFSLIQGTIDAINEQHRQVFEGNLIQAVIRTGERR